MALLTRVVHHPLRSTPKASLCCSRKLPHSSRVLTEDPLPETNKSWALHPGSLAPSAAVSVVRLADAASDASILAAFKLGQDVWQFESFSQVAILW